MTYQFFWHQYYGARNSEGGSCANCPDYDGPPCNFDVEFECPDCSVLYENECTDAGGGPGGTYNGYMMHALQVSAVLYPSYVGYQELVNPGMLRVDWVQDPFVCPFQHSQLQFPDDSPEYFEAAEAVDTFCGINLSKMSVDPYGLITPVPTCGQNSCPCGAYCGRDIWGVAYGSCCPNDQTGQGPYVSTPTHTMVTNQAPAVTSSVLWFARRKGGPFCLDNYWSCEKTSTCPETLYCNNNYSRCDDANDAIGFSTSCGVYSRVVPEGAFETDFGEPDGALYLTLSWTAEWPSQSVRQGWQNLSCSCDNDCSPDDLEPACEVGNWIAVTSVVVYKGTPVTDPTDPDYGSIVYAKYCGSTTCKGKVQCGCNQVDDNFYNPWGPWTTTPPACAINTDIPQGVVGPSSLTIPGECSDWIYFPELPNPWELCDLI